MIVEVKGGAGKAGERGRTSGEKVEDEDGDGVYGTKRKRREEEEEEEEKKKKQQEISEMTDTRFHPVEVTTMFVSRALCGHAGNLSITFPG